MLSRSCLVASGSYRAEHRPTRMGGCCSALRTHPRHDGANSSSDRNGTDGGSPASGLGAAARRGGASAAQLGPEGASAGAQQQPADCVPGCPFCSIACGDSDQGMVVHQVSACAPAAARRHCCCCIVIRTAKLLPGARSNEPCNLAELLCVLEAPISVQSSCLYWVLTLADGAAGCVSRPQPSGHGAPADCPSPTHRQPAQPAAMSRGSCAR